MENTENTKIEKFLLGLGWKRDVDYGGTVTITRPDFEYQVTFHDGYWELGQFTDGDIDGVATGRFQTVEDGEGGTLTELQASLPA